MIKREIKAGDIERERRNKKNKGKKTKVGVPPAVSNPHSGKGTLTVRARIEC